MRLVKSSATLLIAMSMTSSAIAATQAQCVTEAEGSAIFAAMLPELIDGLRDKCSAHLSADAYLPKNADALIARYRLLADQRWPVAKIAFGRMVGQEEMTDKLPDEFFRPMLGAMIGSELVKDIKSQDCGGADRIVESLSPLPPENVAVLIGAIVVLAGNDDDDDDFQICKA